MGVLPPQKKKKGCIIIGKAIEPTIHDHNHQTTAIGIPQSSEHNHWQSPFIGEAQREREKKEVREERERQSRQRKR